jgi:guanosine-3',5'-bis(diphosphate) 3'-pyrophosphohydrolase
MISIYSRLEEKARALAARAHASQKRKYTGDPYIVHPAAVVEIVRSVEAPTEQQLAAAWLHDTVEDCEVTIDEIAETISPVVAGYVYWLTDISRPTDGNRKARKAVDREHIALAPKEVKTIKLADLIDNTSTIVEHDVEFARVYLQEKALLLRVLKEGDAGLYQRAGELLVQSLEKVQ